jgi:hypothetical protein
MATASSESAHTRARACAGLAHTQVLILVFFFHVIATGLANDIDWTRDDVFPTKAP